ncbi:MAG: hypothetical protein WBN30_10355, partial [Polyangiales bacterium]
AQSIMELHGGSLRFTTEPREGTTFTFTLPTLTEAEEASSQGQRATSSDGLPMLVCEGDEGMARSA